MKITQGQIVWLVVEDYKKQFDDDVIARRYYRIAKCEVTRCPAGHFKEFELIEKDHKPRKMYFKTHKQFHDIYENAVEQAERMADSEDDWYFKHYHQAKKIIRPWRDENV